MGYVACIGKMRNPYKYSVENPEGKRKFGRHRHRWNN
jgi:hypothetical protein